MVGRKIIIKQENLLIAYLYELLDRGITEGVTDDEFNTLIYNLQTILDKDNVLPFSIESDSFENVVEKANKLNSERTKGIYIDTSESRLVAVPTYDLKRLEYRMYSTDIYPKHYTILKNMAEARYIPFKYDVDILDCFPKKVIDVAQKVAAIYVNDCINRYVNDRISKGKWPIQCKDIDEYIFKRDIARYIDEEGTKKVLKEAYIHATAAVCEIMKTSKGVEIIEFSNDKYNVLAYANFKKLFMPKAFEFLGQFIYSQYETKNERINVNIGVESVSFSTLSCIYSDPYGEWSDEYERKSGVIDNKPVEIMKKRLGIL